MREEEIKQQVRQAAEALINEWAEEQATAPSRLPLLLSLIRNEDESFTLRSAALETTGKLLCLSSKLSKDHGSMVGDLILEAASAESSSQASLDKTGSVLYEAAVSLAGKMLLADPNANGWMLAPLETLIKSLLSPHQQSTSTDLPVCSLTKIALATFAQVVTSEKVVISPSSISVISKLLLSPVSLVSDLAVAIISRLSISLAGASTPRHSTATGSKKRPLSASSSVPLTPGSGAIQIYLSLFSSCDEDNREALVVKLLGLASPNDLSNDLFVLPVLNLVLSQAVGGREIASVGTLLLAHMTPTSKALSICLQSLEGGNDLSHLSDDPTALTRLRTFILRNKPGAGAGEARGVQNKIDIALDAIKPKKKRGVKMAEA